jgi:hypothetical protein
VSATRRASGFSHGGAAASGRCAQPASAARTAPSRAARAPHLANPANPKRFKPMPPRDGSLPAWIAPRNREPRERVPTVDGQRGRKDDPRTAPDSSSNTTRTLPPREPKLLSASRRRGPKHDRECLAQPVVVIKDGAPPRDGRGSHPRRARTRPDSRARSGPRGLSPSIDPGARPRATAKGSSRERSRRCR